MHRIWSHTFLSNFPRKLWVVKIQIFGNFSCTPREEPDCEGFDWSWGTPCIRKFTYTIMGVKHIYMNVRKSGLQSKTDIWISVSKISVNLFELKNIFVAMGIFCLKGTWYENKSYDDISAVSNISGLKYRFRSLFVATVTMMW